MPRVLSGAAVFLALVLTTAGIGAVASLILSCSATVAPIGGDVPVTASFVGTGNVTVHLFGGTAAGSTAVTINEKTVTLPIGGFVFGVGSADISSGSATILAKIPDEQSLIGSKVMWLAVVTDEKGRIICIARVGGPIIEDAIC